MGDGVTGRVFLCPPSSHRGDGREQGLGLRLITQDPALPITLTPGHPITP